MPDYNLYPSIDSEYNFPRPVRKALSESTEFKTLFADKSAETLNVPRQISTPINFDDFKTNDLVHLNRNADFTDAETQHFPVKAAGILKVTHIAGMNVVYQDYWTYADNNRRFWRGYYDWNKTWTPWKEFATGKTFNGQIAFGSTALANLPDNYANENNTIIAIGKGALQEATQVKQSIAIGSRALGQALISRDNIAIGDSSLYHLQGDSPHYDQQKKHGTRNVAIGGLAGYFITKGWGHTLIGRGAGQCLDGGRGMVAIGGSAAGGAAPIGFTGDIENWSPWKLGPEDIVNSVFIGTSVGTLCTARNNVGVGGSALVSAKKSDFNVAIGADTLREIDSHIGSNGGEEVTANVEGTYVHDGNRLTITNSSPHSLKVGDIAYTRLTSGESETFQGDKALAYVLSVPNSNTYVVNHPISRWASGTSLYLGKETTAQVERSEYNTALGHAAGGSMQTGMDNNFIGAHSATNAVTSSRSTAIGRQALYRATNIAGSTVVGYYSAGFMTDANEVTTLGNNTLRAKLDGSNMTDNWRNITAIGYDARVSGPNQVQLGDSRTTTYVYGTVQNRSDVRDKADIRDTTLGLNFIEKLRPVDFRWDIREDYFDTDEDGNVTPKDKDGSKKRDRFHHGFIAQEVQEVISNTGVDFGGLQDHNVNGGSDVLSIGYDEIIAPLVKAVQELKTENDMLKGRLNKIEELLAVVDK